MVIIFLLINNYILINNGLWKKREQEIENIYKANDRIIRTKYIDNIEERNELNDIYLSHDKPLEKPINSNKKIKLNFLKNIKRASKTNLEIFKNINDKKDEKEFKNYAKLESFSEKNKKYFERLFPKIRNEKPGRDFYVLYSLSMILIIIFIVIFYTTMIQDITYALSQETNQFNSSMIIFFLIHIIFLFYDRVIYINQNRNNLKYNYIIYDKEKKKPITETKFNQIIKEISISHKNDENIENFIIHPDFARELSKDFNIIYIQNEDYNKPLLQKYILHIFIVLFSHIFIFFYSPMMGNYNVNRKVYCSKDDNNDNNNDNDDVDNNDFCNDFNKNWALICFYIIYISYYVFSGVQIQFGFYDMRRKSILKSGNSSMYGIINNSFNNIPFVYELKLAIDWTFTSTCLDLFQWNKFESIYNTVYSTFCSMNEKNKTFIGQQIGKIYKVGMGGTLSFGLIILIIAPILLFSSLNPTNEINTLTGATLTVELSFLYYNGLIMNYTLFQNTKPESIEDFLENDKDWINYNYSKSMNTKNFAKEQIQKLQFSNTSDRNWKLAKPHIEKLIETLEWERENETDLKEIQLIIDYQFQRLLPLEARIAKERKGFVIFDKDKDKTINDTSEIGKIKNAIDYCFDTKVVFKNLYSAPIRLTANTDAREIEDEKYIKKFDVFLGFTGCKNVTYNNINSTEILNDVIDDDNNNMNHSYLQSYFTFGNNENDKGLLFHVFSDKVSASISGYSIITIYVSFILLAGNYIRNFFAGEPSKVSLTEMPYCSKIIELCEGIQISRYSYDFEQEEKLYYILIEFMRSPDYLRYLTKSSVEQFNKRKKLTENKDSNINI